MPNLVFHQVDGQRGLPPSQSKERTLRPGIGTMANTSTMPERTPPRWPVQSSETLPSPDAREADILPIQDTASRLNLDPCPWSWARLVIDTSNKQGYWAGKSNDSSRHPRNLGNPVLTRCSHKFLLLLWATDMTVSHGGGHSDGVQGDNTDNLPNRETDGQKGAEWLVLLGSFSWAMSGQLGFDFSSSSFFF